MSTGSSIQDEVSRAVLSSRVKSRVYMYIYREREDVYITGPRHHLNSSLRVHAQRDVNRVTCMDCSVRCPVRLKLEWVTSMK
jgi:hypothetical protein